jgi:chemotaxis protein MotB
MKKLLSFILLTGLTLACVPPTRFKALQSETLTCQEERDRLRAENEKMGVDNRELNSKLAQADKTLAEAGRDTVKWKEEAARLAVQNRQLAKDYSDLQEAHQALLKGSEGEVRSLMDELQNTQKDLQKRGSELGKMSADVKERQGSLDKMQQELNERNARLAELEVILKNQETVLTSLKKKVSDALLGFENQGLTITQKNGKVYVSLEEKLLFKSGSTVVDPKGITALKKLSRVLEQNPDINVMIEGHTDDVPVMTGSQFKDNWDLSVLRATSIVRILLEGSSINPQRLTTAGRSQYLPVDPAKTADARQKNRRTEIILSPKLDELYDLINK